MHTEKHGEETHLDKIEARAGSRNTTNRNVLVASLLLVVLVFGVVVGSVYFQPDRTGAGEVTSENEAIKEGSQ